MNLLRCDASPFAKATEDKNMRIIFKILLIFGVILEIGVIVYFAVPLVLNTPVSFVRIKSDSMLPELSSGDLVLINGRHKDEISNLKDQVIAFYDPVLGKIIVHRAVGESSGCLVTKGDSNREEDFFRVCEEYVLGKVAFVF